MKDTPSTIQAERQLLSDLAHALLPHRQLPGLAPFDLLRLTKEVMARREAAGVKASVRFLCWVCDLPEPLYPGRRFEMDDFGRLDDGQRRIVAEWLKEGRRLTTLGTELSRSAESDACPLPNDGV